MWAQVPQPQHVSGSITGGMMMSYLLRMQRFGLHERNNKQKEWNALKKR